MKIAFFVNTFPARSETFILRQIGGLLDRGHDVHVYASELGEPVQLHADFKEYKLLEKARQYRSTPAPSLTLRLGRRVRALFANILRHPAVVLRSLNLFRYGKGALSLDILDMALCLIDRPAYDIVHCHFGPIGNDAAVLIDLGVLRGKLITTFHSYDILLGIETKGACYRRLIRRAAAIHSISEYNRQWLERFGFPVDRIHYHPMGIDVASFAEAKRREPGNGRVMVLSIARLAPEKGLEYALEALAAVARRRPDIALRYRVIGGGPLACALQARAVQLGLEDVVEFLGPQDQGVVRAALTEADLFLLPSLAEALPIAIMEAMASRLPVVATDVGSVAELVRDRETGRLVPSGDVTALQDALLDLLQDRKDWRRLGEAGLALVSARHDTAVLSDRLVKHYAELVSEEAPARRAPATKGGTVVHLHEKMRRA